MLWSFQTEGRRGGWRKTDGEVGGGDQEVVEALKLIALYAQTVDA